MTTNFTIFGLFSSYFMQLAAERCIKAILSLACPAHNILKAHPNWDSFPKKALISDNIGDDLFLLKDGHQNVYPELQQ